MSASCRLEHVLPLCQGDPSGDVLRLPPDLERLAPRSSCQCVSFRLTYMQPMGLGLAEEHLANVLHRSLRPILRKGQHAMAILEMCRVPFAVLPCVLVVRHASMSIRMWCIAEVVSVRSIQLSPRLQRRSGLSRTAMFAGGVLVPVRPDALDVSSRVPTFSLFRMFTIVSRAFRSLNQCSGRRRLRKWRCEPSVGAGGLRSHGAAGVRKHRSVKRPAGIH